jgi:hypothetical protein
LKLPSFLQIEKLFTFSKVIKLLRSKENPETRKSLGTRKSLDRFLGETLESIPRKKTVVKVSIGSAGKLSTGGWRSCSRALFKLL